MSRRLCLFIAGCVVGVVGVAERAQASLAVQFTSEVLSYNTAEISAGFSFTPTVNIQIGDLDCYLPDTSSGDVRLYNGGAATLASATVLDTDPTETTGGLTYNVHAITPVSLTAGTTYYIAADIPTDLSDTVPVGVSALTTDPAITYGNGVLQLGNVNPLTDAFSGSNDPAYFKANFDVVPEPSMLAGVCLVGMVGLLRRTRRSI